MKVTKILVGMMMLFLLPGCNSSGSKEHLSTEAVIPQPVRLDKKEGSFVFNAKTTFSVENEEQVNILNQLINRFSCAAGFSPIYEINSMSANVVFVTDTLLGEEAYRLEVTPDKIIIKGGGNKGFFYALQTIRQLLPPAIESKELTKGYEWSIPALNIEDSPRFEYRGLLIDAARFFIPKETVLKIIDCAAMLKINKLHFHLTDDNGWRLEIKKYPKLTEIGAWRVERNVPFSARRNPQKGEPTPVGGFYTQEDIKEIVRFASDRQIEVIPEIEMPAHTNSSLAAYPQLACPVVDKFIGVLPGMGSANSEIIYCAGNDSVFTFLEDVIDEVLTLFPSKYIHLGGDEASKKNWEKCPKCQARMKQEHITDIEELQGYFMKRMCDYVRSKGREVIGWDELTNSTLPDSVIILGWQGFGTAALKAARQGHRFIMTPARIMYLIRYQGPQWFEPLTYFGNNTLKNVYDYEPVQEDWEPEIIPLLMGVQASLWTEFCNKPEDTEYLIFPRLAALAELAWSPKGTKDWRGFLKRLDALSKHWDIMGVNYAHSMFNLDHCVMPDGNGNLKVSISCIRPDVEIHYTLDGTEPTSESLIYRDTLIVDNALTVKAATFMNGEQKGKMLELKLGRNKATGKTVMGKDTNGRVYVLTNGLRGSDRHSDFEWAGWYDQDASFVVNLGQEETIRKVTLGCITNYGMAVHIPATIKVLVSDDDKNYTCVARREHTSEEIFKEGTFITDEVFDNLSVKGRYIKMEMTNPGVCPEDHIRPGKNIWMYFDELIVE
ncbi:beta-hexosaminidase [Bacteroides sp. AF16-49]|jgi:hexosaminidase|nr:beta-hexosaminidase [Bacteroides sp. OM05-12]RHR75179.1 beta-hexosaminidase [Bacteroides sp. AF16-49]